MKGRSSPPRTELAPHCPFTLAQPDDCPPPRALCSAPPTLTPSLCPQLSWGPWLQKLGPRTRFPWPAPPEGGHVLGSQNRVQHSLPQGPRPWTSSPTYYKNDRRASQDTGQGRPVTPRDPAAGARALTAGATPVLPPPSRQGWASACLPGGEALAGPTPSPHRAWFWPQGQVDGGHAARGAHGLLPRHHRRAQAARRTHSHRHQAADLGQAWGEPPPD